MTVSASDGVDAQSGRVSLDSRLSSGQVSLDFLLAVAALVAFLSLILLTWAGVRSAFFANADYKISEAALSEVSNAAELACGMGNGNVQAVQVNADGNFSFEDTGLIWLSYSNKKIYSSVPCPFVRSSIAVMQGEKLEIRNVHGQLSVSKMSADSQGSK